MSRHRFIIVLGIAISTAVVLGATAITLSAQSQGIESSTVNSVTVGTSQQIPLSDPQLAPIVSRMKAQPALYATLGDPPEGFSANPTYGAFGNKWLYVTSVVTEFTNVAEAKVAWQGFMLAGATRDMMHVSGDDLLGVTITAFSRDGSTRELTSSLIGGSFIHSVDERAMEVQRASVDSAIASLPHVKQSSVTFLDAMGYAPVVNIQTDNPVAFLRAKPLQRILDTQKSWAGVFFAVFDTDGQPLVVRGTSTRAQMSVGFTSPGIDDRATSN